MTNLILGDRKYFNCYEKKLFDNLSNFNAKVYMDIVNNIVNDVENEVLSLNIYNNLIRNSNEDTINFENYSFFENKYINNFLYHLGSGGFGMVLRIDDIYCLKITLDDTRHEFESPNSLVNYLENNEYCNFLLIPKTFIENYNIRGVIHNYNIHALIICIMDIILKKKKFDVHILKEKMIDFKFIERKYIELFYNRETDDNMRRKKKKEIINNYKFFTYIFLKYMKKGGTEFIHLYNNIVLINKFKNVINIVQYIINERNKVKKDDYFYVIGNLIILPLAKCISTKLKLDDKTKTIDMKNGKIAYIVDKDFFRLLVLQVLLILLKLNSEDIFYFYHNDLKPDNILVFEKEDNLIIKYKDKKIIFEEKYIFKISDFGLSKVPNIINKKFSRQEIDNVIFDIHYFVHTLFIYEKNLKSLDTELYNSLKKTFIDDICNNIKNLDTVVCSKWRYYGNKKLSIEDLENYIFNNKLFRKWIK